jgi:uncharacterized coiled-coil DUF342 family protein
VLAADTGVTKSDIEVWRKHIGGPRKQGRLVVLNKIDSMWDDLKTPSEVDAEIEKQVESCAHILGLETHQMFPVSAQKGLLAKVHHDDPLLAKSRLPALERALSIELIPQKQSIVREIVRQEMGELVRNAQATLASRGTGLNTQAGELRSLRGKNSSVVAHMVTRVRAEKEQFDKSLVQFQALRAVYGRLTADVFDELGMARLRQQAKGTRERMLNPLQTSGGLRGAMGDFFTQVHTTLTRSQAKTDEIAAMIRHMYQKFSSEHAMVLTDPMGFSLTRYVNEVNRVQKVYEQRFGFLTTLSNDQVTLTQKFYESIASRIKECFEMANRDVEAWLKAIIAPLEGQIREHQMQLRRRLESIKHIQDASETLEERIGELNAQETDLERIHARLAELSQAITWTLQATIDADQGALII